MRVNIAEPVGALKASIINDYRRSMKDKSHRVGVLFQVELINLFNRELLQICSIIRTLNQLQCRVAIACSC